ncbi:hypothetical protein [Enterococcus sp. LJL51]|uniref:hypothetical protein n=1 Tax=Enterococcus sp. LJL51 TaxID=3416656 RepID=UPI003CE90799
MKKWIFGVALVVSSLFLGAGYQAEAQVTENGGASSIQPLLSPLVYEQTLKSGDSVQLNLGAFYDENFCSKYTLKVKVDSPNNQSIIVRKEVGFRNQPQTVETKYFYSNGFTWNFSLEENVNPDPWYIHGTTKLTITNYEAAPITIKYGVSSGIHVKGQCVNYGDIDFSL